MKNKLILSIFSLVIGFECASQCDNGQGSDIYDKQADYSCHQYVKAALLNDWVNLSTGIPTHDESDFLGFSGDVASDENFIRVCSKSDAGAVVPVGASAYHSAIILNNGFFVSSPNNDVKNLYQHQNPRTFTSACNEEWYAAIPDIKISGSSGVNQGMNITLTLTNDGQPFPSYLQLDKNKWGFNSDYFTRDSYSSTSLTLKAKNNTGSSEIEYTLLTGCNGSGLKRTKSIQVLPNCTGTLNGGPLYTFNMVSGGQNQVEMYLNSWTWVKTSGNASWSTINGGKNMSFTISSGCATFNAYNASCNQSFTFCKTYSMSYYAVIDAKTLSVIQEGSIEDLEEVSKFLAELPAGSYIINMDGNTTRMVKSQ
jgi:hypothetical protein